MAITSALVEYHFYFHPRKIYRDPKRESLDKQDEFIYDLVRDPKDICFKIDGGPSDSDSYSFHTNTVRVSKAQLIAAFSKAHLSCLDSERYCLRPSFAGDK